MRVLGVDLASRRWRDVGTALFDRDPLRARVGVVEWPAAGRPDAETIAARAAELAPDVVAIDGPAGWRDPRHGRMRACERALAAQVKTGLPGEALPRSAAGWAALSVELHERLEALGIRTVEAYPAATWKALGARRDPAALGIAVDGEPTPHDVDAIAAALPAVGGPFRGVRHGLPLELVDGARVEGEIWVAEWAPLLLLVTGPPGSGKTTLARGLADALDLPLVEKDALKEAIGGPLGIEDRETSRRLGGAVFDTMALVVHDLLRRGVAVIAEGNFRSGAAIARDLPPCRVVQLHVTAAAEELHRRLLARDTHRHPVHYDAAAADEIRDAVLAGEWQALRLPGKTVAIDTTRRFHDPRRVASILSRFLL